MRPLTPDMYALGAIVAAIIAEWLFPIGWAPGVASPMTWIGVVVAVGGLALEISAGRALTAARTTARPNGEPQVLVTTGPFARSRNPFYLGLLLVLFGAFLAVGLEWGVLFTTGVWLTLDRRVVPQEEAKLRALDPAAFDLYARKVRRWL